jgi:hypothetical protein
MWLSLSWHYSVYILHPVMIIIMTANILWKVQCWTLLKTPWGLFHFPLTTNWWNRFHDYPHLQNGKLRTRMGRWFPLAMSLSSVRSLFLLFQFVHHRCSKIFITWCFAKAKGGISKYLLDIAWMCYHIFLVTQPQLQFLPLAQSIYMQPASCASL